MSPMASMVAWLEDEQDTWRLLYWLAPGRKWIVASHASAIKHHDDRVVVLLSAALENSRQQRRAWAMSAWKEAQYNGGPRGVSSCHMIDNTASTHLHRPWHSLSSNHDGNGHVIPTKMTSRACHEYIRERIPHFMDGSESRRTGIYVLGLSRRGARY